MGAQTSVPSTTFEDVSTAAAVNPPESTAPAGTRLPSTRASRAWSRLLPALALVVVMLVFVLQNLHRAKVSFLGWSGTLPLAVALLAAAAVGGLFVLAVGSVRMVQLRRVIRKERHSRHQ